MIQTMKSQSDPNRTVTFPVLLTLFLQMLFAPGPLHAAGERPLVGVVSYPVWGARGSGGIWDEISLTPPKWSYRLPFFADVRDDSCRLTRTVNSEQEIVYRFNYDISHITIFAAFNDTETCNPAADIDVSTSPDNTTYTSQTMTFRKIALATDWQKVTLFSAINTAGARYVKIKISKTDGTASNPQLMRVDINYRVESTDHPFKSVLTDNMNDFMKMFSHSTGLAIATDIPSRYRLVTGMEYSQENVDRQILYAKANHIDYFALLNSSPSSCLQVFVDLLRTSAYKNDVKYCLIVFGPNSGETWTNKVARCVEYFHDSNYVNVLNGRPLVYLYDQSQHTAVEINQLCSTSVASGAGVPYLVGLQNSTSSFLDAGSYYNLTSVGVYQNFAGTANTIPFVSFGDNTMPREDNPPSWGNFAALSGTEMTGTQMVPYITQALNWCSNNMAQVPANAILINSWDEFCESSSSLCPSRNPATGLPDTSRVEAIGNAIEAWSTAGAMNMVANGDFTSTSQWVFYKENEASAVFSVDNGMGRVAISSGAVNTWDIQLYQAGLYFTVGTTYHVRFKAKAAASRTLTVAIQMNNNPWTGAWTQSVNLDTSVQSFGEYEFVFNGTAGVEYRLNFTPGGNNNSVWIDDVEVYEVFQ
ncbi:MAG: carbohydrate binding domain-containing protein, partial [Fibrobacterota bacterium]